MRSNRRTNDTTPREWCAGLLPNAVLFPRLAKRRTWLIVKKDLERVGIPYRTDEDIADFHASDRHTHITQLLRNGATLPVAMELAHHSDVRTTMKYTHIDINDQERALANLPCQDIVRKLHSFDGKTCLCLTTKVMTALRRDATQTP